jgi:hypothetical protein
MTATMDASRWEQGSDFFLALEGGSLEAPWLERPHSLWGSGRDAIRALLAWGRDRYGWKRLRVPTYFCQETLDALLEEWPIVLYEDAPDRPLPARVPAEPSDVLLINNFFGMRRTLRLDTEAVVVEDHTHDPLSPYAFASDADYAVASLRKTLPLPDGAVLWSPNGTELPPEQPVTGHHLRVTHDRLSAMVLKLLYLTGSYVHKAEFRGRFADAERMIGAGPISGISPFSRELLRSLPARPWREARSDNLATLRSRLGNPPGFRLLDAPFAATLLFDSAHLRERVRTALIAERIYPAVLWPLEQPRLQGIPAEHVELSRRLLTLHCDFRYNADDMARVAARVIEVCVPETPGELALFQDTHAGRSV